MSNKRISELPAIAWNNVAGDDLFYIVDVSAINSKKILASELAKYILNDGHLSGEIESASYAKTASYIDPANVGLIDSASYALSASYAQTASYAFNAKSSSYIKSSDIDGAIPTSSYSKTASYVLYTPNIDNGTVYNSISASFSDYSDTASFLQYFGYNNGTASHAITASYCLVAQSIVSGAINFVDNCSHSIESDTASYLKYTGIFNGTASYAMECLSASYAKTSSFLNYIPGEYNGTASYAISSSRSITSSYAFTSSYAVNASRSIIANYAENANSAQTALSANTSHTSISSKTAWRSDYATYAVTASYVHNVVDLNEYNVFGPFTASSVSSTKGTLYAYAIIGEGETDYKATIIRAYGDLKVPITNGVADPSPMGYAALNVQNLDPGSPWTLQLDKTQVSNVISVTVATSISGGLSFTDAEVKDIPKVNLIGYTTGTVTGTIASVATVSGWTRQGFSLTGKTNLSGSYLQIYVETGNGVTLDTTRGIYFYIMTKSDNVRIQPTETI